MGLKLVRREADNIKNKRKKRGQYLTVLILLIALAVAMFLLRSTPGKDVPVEQGNHSDQYVDLDCEKLEGSQRGSCYSDQALQNLDEKTCKKAGGFIYECYYRLAKETKNRELCLESGDMREKCLKEIQVSDSE